jgi:hypothetical protein
MEDYTREEVLKELSLLDKKSRKRVLVDQRTYLVAILAYRFMLSEHTISRLTGISRDTVNYNKTVALQYFTDKAYKQNVYVLSVKFPFDLSVIDTRRPHRQVRIELDVDRKFYNKLKAAGAILGHKDVRTTIKLFLDKSLKLWEE